MIHDGKPQKRRIRMSGDNILNIRDCNGVWLIPLPEGTEVPADLISRLATTNINTNVGIAFAPGVVCLFDKASHGTAEAMNDVLLQVAVLIVRRLQQHGILAADLATRVVKGDIRRVFAD